MKRLIASAGLVAIGASGLQAANTGGLSDSQVSKPWSVSATLRGFYDDNYATLPKSSPLKKDSYGLEFKPAGSVHFLPTDQTFIALSYVYSLKYYFDRPDSSTDQSHEATIKLDHRFTERYRLTFEDAFAYSQEPEVIDSTGPITTPIKTNSDALRNNAALKFDGQLTELLGYQLGYQNTVYDYTQTGVGSRSALLDRYEHLINADLRAQLQEHLTALAGYQFGYVDFTGSEPIFAGGPLGSIRDNFSHYLYVGGEYAVSSQLKGAAKVGVEYTRFPHLNNTEVNPYADINATYTYLPGSFVQVGFKNARNATDVADAGDQQSATFYASVNHRITSQLTASLLGQFQHSTYTGGASDGNVDKYFLLGMNLEYRINQNWAAEIGYNYDRYDSDLAGRSFTRNKVYIGARASY